MATTKAVAGIYFNDGCIKHKDFVYIAGKLKTIDPNVYDLSRMCQYKSPRWGYHDLKWNIVSVCYFSVDASLHCLSSAGDVEVAISGVPFRAEKIADVDDIGAVSQIRQIGDHLYVCGMQGQVYRRERGGWVHVDDGILDRKVSVHALQLNGIDGTSDRDIYVAGFGGRIHHFDGHRWTELNSPTNLHLERVHCAGEATYFCGNKGTFLKLANGVFTDLSIDIPDHFWGLTAFGGKMYLATLKGLYVFDGARVQPVATGLEPPIGGYRLDARDGQLWSFGVDDLAWFDGTTWTRLKHPDNP